MANFKVGDKVRVVSIATHAMSGFKVGDICEVTNVNARGLNRYGIRRGFLHGYANEENLTRHIADTPDLTARVTELEAEVKALKAQLAGKADKPTLAMTLADAADSMTKAMQILAKVGATVKTPNQRRSDVIKQARAYVEYLLTEIDGQLGWSRTVIPLYRRCGRLRVEFVVNNDKRTVVALARLGNMQKHPEVYGKGIAKCAPGDVFNADIGKAIALGRALGVDVPAEFFKAPQPTEAVDGQIITFPTYDGWHRKVNYRVDGVNEREYCLSVARDDIGGEIGMRAYLGDGLGHLVIIDDTEAQY
ncbi:hypothetical protein MHZ92_14500 [Sporosarcina sp. ACRSL]|uniref:hypothetical protein n=1 Tax=Sporosarcina sp. ACRSL TaxID=2918215 RepID=UPI001EF6E02A|nr:hypothetical protein [Sporosarcina sp. ACRSL]MCG7345346.1 hypothetical protein [Sporosarcina sp. ACRSL]